MMAFKYRGSTAVEENVRLYKAFGDTSTNSAEKNNVEWAIQLNQDTSDKGSSKKRLPDMPLIDLESYESPDREDTRVFGTACIQFNRSRPNFGIKLKKNNHESSNSNSNTNNKRKCEQKEVESGHFMKFKETNLKPFQECSDSTNSKNHDFNIALSDWNYVVSNEKQPKRKSRKKNKENTEACTQLKTVLESNNKGKQLMQKSGYREGQRLGKNGQGRVDPVQLSKQKGRRGLGLAVPRSDGEKIKWDPSLEEINDKEPVYWLKNNKDESIVFETMILHWLNEGPKNYDIKSMTEFIDEEVISDILVKKCFFEKISEHEFMLAVRRSNPFESIQKGIFLNQDALKMANMDYAFDYMFTNPKYRDNSPMVKDNELLYFADVCAGPGGFSEYVLFRKKWRAKGIGFTLKGDDDFKLHDFRAGPSEFFEPFYGLKNDGNIYDPHNITKLTEFVMEVTNGKGVHFMMADGGFSGKGNKNMQELLSKQMYLCQFLTALSIVREEGHFVCKLFDLFSEFSAGLIYLMYRAFHKISIFKPNTSRPANSERYIICKHKRNDTKAIEVYLYEISLTLWKYSDDSKVDINSCVPTKVMKDDFTFFNYLRDSNNRLGKKQIVNLDKIALYYQDQSLHEPSQNELRTRCMQLWNVPTSLRKTDQMTDSGAAKFISQTILKYKNKPEVDILNHSGKLLTSYNFEVIFSNSILDWQCILLGSTKLCFLLGLGKNRVHRWDGAQWVRVTTNMELPAGTLIYGHFFYEYREEGTKQTRTEAYNIIDGFALDYKPITHYPYEKRLAMLKLFSKALRKWNDRSLCPIRVAIPTEMRHINRLLPRLKAHLIKSTKRVETCLFSNENTFFMQIKGLLFVRITKEPWEKHFSKKQNRYYYYNSKSKESLFEEDRPDEAVASALDSLNDRVMWEFLPGVGLDGELREDNILHKDDLLDYIYRKNSKI